MILAIWRWARCERGERSHVQGTLLQALFVVPGAWNRRRNLGILLSSCINLESGLASKQQIRMTKCLYSLLVNFIMHYSFI
jgi:hypothetical protein